jgi:polyphosphate kinase
VTGNLNRELSWLDFNARVLALAENERLPLLERARFLAISSQNLDEFFQVRVGGLKVQISAGEGATSASAVTPQSQLIEIRPRVEELVTRTALAFEESMVPALAKAEIAIVPFAALDEAEREYMSSVFADQIFPVLTPLAVDPAHPFPYISNLSLNLAVVIAAEGDEPRIARIKVPGSLPRFVPTLRNRSGLSGSGRFVPLEQVIAAHLDALFPGVQILGTHLFRVTRNADIALEDEAEDLLAAVEEVLRLRRRSPHAVRLEIAPGMTPTVRDLLLDELEIEASDVYVVPGTLDLGSLWSMYALRRPELKFDTWVPVTPPRLVPAEPDRPVDFFRVLGNGDVLLHHPYESFAKSVEAFIDQAARDPNVMAIKQTIYRTSGGESRIIKSLIRAAEAGKQVVVVVEVTARFDEAANIEWARALEQAGAHVVYGIVGLKTHAKLLLVVRREEGGLRRYTHASTGNYNPKTAELYEDIGLLSADPVLGNDVAEVFNYLTGYSKQSEYDKLLVSPVGLRRRLFELIRSQAKPGGEIVIKINHLTDPETIAVLESASQAGARIEMIVRGMCCLRPGVPGVSDNIYVRSVVGRFLEHSRVYRFGPPGSGAAYYIGSADLMTRNLDRRVESLVPVADPVLQSRLEDVLTVNLTHDAIAWALQPDGSWRRINDDHGVPSQRRFQDIALARVQRQAEPVG